MTVGIMVSASLSAKQEINVFAFCWRLAGAGVRLYTFIVVRLSLDFFLVVLKPNCNASVPCKILSLKKIIRRVTEPSMKLIVPFALFIVVGFILAAACITIKNKNPMNSSSNATDSSLNVTPNITSMLKGSLIVSVTGFSYPTNLSVFLDNQTVGMVNPSNPLYLMVSEGNHTIGLCADFVCEQENVTIRFGRYVTVDFSERLHRDVVIMQPTARILECYTNGKALSVNIEFINPSRKDLQMSVVVSCGYSYIDARTGIKMGDSTRGTLVQNVKAGQRITNALYLNLVKGNSLSYSYPVIEEIKVK